MKRINRLLFTFALVLTCFIGLKSVNAETISSPDAACGDFPKDGDSLVTNCTSSGFESELFDVTVTNWYKGDLYDSTAEDPGDAVGLSGVYESGYKYYLELKFTPKTGNEFAGNVNFNIIGLSDGYIADVTEDGDYIVVFEYVVHHIVHFVTYGGTAIADIVVEDWCNFDMPDDPVKEGYTFLAWYTDPEFDESYYGWCVEESMTLYAKYVPNANIVKNINVTLEAPIAGTDIVVNSGIDEEWGYAWETQEPQPIATAPDGAHFTVEYTAWVKGICDMSNEIYLCDEKFDGTIAANEYYYAMIEVATDDDYAMIADDLTIKVNGEDPDEVFTVYYNSYTRFVAKIKSVKADTMISSNKKSIDFGETFPGLENAAYQALEQKVTFTNTGVTTVTLDIDNPTTQGFGSMSFDSTKELAPGESMEIGLIPHPSYIFSKVPGEYQGVYKITATNVEDEDDTYTVNLSAKIVVLEKDITDAKVDGIKVQTYNGKQQRQNIVVNLFGKELVKGTDYQVYYSNLVNAGTIKMTIVGIGNYEGKIVKTFTRKKAANTLSIKSANKTVYYSKVKNAAQVVKPITIVKKQGTLTYTKLSGSSAKLTINKTTGKVTVKKGTKKGKYKIRIKVSASATTNYLSKYIIRTVYVTVK